MYDNLPYFCAMKKIKGAIAVFIGAVSFGLLSTFVKKAYAEDFSLAEITGVQVGFGMTILWAMYLIVHRINKKSLDKHAQKSSKWLIVLSGLSTGSVSILYYKCVELLPASLAIVMLMQYIWISILIEYFIFKSRPSVRQIIGAIFILFSTLLATGIMDSNLSTVNLAGIIYGLLAATAYSLFLIVNGRVGNDYSPIHKSALMLTGSFALICIVLTPVSLLNTTTLQHILPYALLLSVFGTVLPPLLFAYGIPKTGVSLATIISAVELPVAVGMAYFLLYETVTWVQWLGILIILITIMWINYFKKTKQIT